FERALRSLQFVALSPRTLGAKQTQLWATRVCVAALAGDGDLVEELLGQREYASRARAFTRFAAYWRGRCALARGELQEAAQLFTRAFALTHPRSRLWRDAILQQMHRVEEEKLPVSWAVQDPTYAHGQELLCRADNDAAPWRALMYMGRPELATLVLLLIF